MGLSSSTSQYTVTSRFASTGLTCTGDVARRVDGLAAPYLTVEPGLPSPGSWQVVAGAATATGTVPESVTAQGEISVGYAIDHPGRTLFHLAPTDEAWVVQSLLRATRAIHRSVAGRSGVLFLHAGLVELDGIGVALVGGSRSGKTSFIMASVLNGSGVMVSNDDVSLVTDPAGAGVVGDGWPRSISVRLDTMDLLFGPDRAAEVRASLSHPANRTLGSLRDSGVEPQGTALLYPWEYAQVMQTKIAQQARVAALVYLGFTDDPAAAGLRPVAPQDRAGLLSERTLSEPNKHLNIFGHEPVGGSLGRTVRALTELPTFSFRYPFRDVRRQVDLLAGHLHRHLAES